MAQHIIAIDTFQYAKDLQKAGFTETQVETQVKYIKEQTKNINEWIDDSLATKQDIKELDLKIETIRKELILKIESIKNEMVIKLGGIVIGCTGLLVLFMKLFRL